jgi:hypothetical protein
MNKYFICIHTKILFRNSLCYWQCNKPTDTKNGADIIQALQHAFSTHFQDFRKQEGTLTFFSSPFDTGVKTVPDEFQSEIMVSQCNKK